MSNLTKSEVREVSFTLKHPFWPNNLALLVWFGTFAALFLIILLLSGSSGFNESGLPIGALILGVMMALVGCMAAAMAFSPTKKRLYTRQLIEQLNQDYLGVSIRDASGWEGELSTNNVVPLRMQSRDGKWLNATAYRSKQRYLSDGVVVCHYLLIIDSD